MVYTLSGTGDPPGAVVDSSEEGCVIHDIPHAVADLLKPDVLIAKGVAEEGLRGFQPEGAG